MIVKYEKDMSDKKKAFKEERAKCGCDGKCQLGDRGGREEMCRGGKPRSTEFFAFDKKEKAFVEEMKALESKSGSVEKR